LWVAISGRGLHGIQTSGPFSPSVRGSVNSEFYDYNNYNFFRTIGIVKFLKCIVKFVVIKLFYCANIFLPFVNY
jgi:uncharacterized protein YdaL